MERYVAVDNVCAWPNLTLLPDGSIVAMIFNQPGHGTTEGDVECWASEDGGCTWRLRGVPAPHEPTTNRMNVAVGLAHNGDLVVLASGWDKRPPVGQGSHADLGQKVLPTWVCRSKDGGRTWTHADGKVNPPAGTDCIIPFGDIVKLSGKSLGACIYGCDWADKTYSSLFYVSDDDGMNWDYRGTIAGSDANETTPIRLADGKLLAAVRTARDQRIDLHESSDEGKSWTMRGPVTLPMQHPGHLLQLADGRLLLSYGVRNRGAYGVAARFSSDAGATWSQPRQLVTLCDNLQRNKLYPKGTGKKTPYTEIQDGGYPSSVQIADGIIVTAYYSRGIPEHDRYHMGVVRWLAE